VSSFSSRFWQVAHLLLQTPYSEEVDAQPYLRMVFPPNVWGVIFSKLDCPRSRLCLLLAGKGMPEVLAHVNVEFTSCSTSAESFIVAQEAASGRRHFSVTAKPAGLPEPFLVPEEQGLLWACNIWCSVWLSWLRWSLQQLWLPKTVHRLKLDLSTLSSRGSLDLTGLNSLSCLCELDMRGATIRDAALDDCLRLKSLTLHCVTLESEVPMPESLQTVSLSHVCVDAPFPTFPRWNDTDSFAFCLDLTSAKAFRELEMHKSDRDIAVRLPPCVKKVSITCATLDYLQVERLFSGLTALEDARIAICDVGLMPHTGAPYFAESLLQTITSAPRHYFEWQWYNTYSRQVEVAEQHDVLRNYAADVMWIPNMGIPKPSPSTDQADSAGDRSHPHEDAMHISQRIQFEPKCTVDKVCLVCLVGC